MWSFRRRKWDVTPGIPVVCPPVDAVVQERNSYPVGKGDEIRLPEVARLHLRHSIRQKYGIRPEA